MHAQFLVDCLSRPAAATRPVLRVDRAAAAQQGATAGTAAHVSAPDTGQPLSCHSVRHDTTPA